MSDQKLGFVQEKNSVYDMTRVDLPKQDQGASLFNDTNPKSALVQKKSRCMHFWTWFSPLITARKKSIWVYDQHEGKTFIFYFFGVLSEYLVIRPLVFHKLLHWTTRSD